MYILSKKRQLVSIIWIFVMMWFTIAFLNPENHDENKGRDDENVVIVGFRIGPRKPSIYDGLKKG